MLCALAKPAELCDAILVMWSLTNQLITNEFISLDPKPIDPNDQKIKAILGC